MIIRGNLDVGVVFLAPMAGVTDLVYRKICREYGADMVYTEMVSSNGLYYNDEKSISMLETQVTERPVALQIFGNEPEIMASVVERYINDLEHVDILDINMGCPAPKIVNNGNGSALMKNPILAGRIIEAVAKQSKKPVTVKIRKGWDDTQINAVEFAKILEASGAEAITVHGRTRDQFYAGKADWDIIGEVKAAVKIPVIGNGDVFSAEDGLEMLAKTGCDAIMIGRGCQGNPWLFKQIKQGINQELIKVPSASEKIDLAISHLEKLAAYKGEHCAVKEMRKHMGWYIKGLKNATEVRRIINTLNTKSEVAEVLKQYREDV